MAIADIISLVNELGAPWALAVIAGYAWWQASKKNGELYQQLIDVQKPLFDAIETLKEISRRGGS